MVRRWVGPVNPPGGTFDNWGLGYVEGYQAAMNGPVVVGLVAHLRELIKQCSQWHMSTWSNRMAGVSQPGLAAYEAGLEPVKGDKHV